jgi:hypothetical protein
MDDINAAAARFKAAAKAFAETVKQVEELELDVRIALRSNIPALDAEQARDSYRQNNWYPAYKEREDAAQALCKAIGVSASDLKYSL